MVKKISTQHFKDLVVKLNSFISEGHVKEHLKKSLNAASKKTIEDTFIGLVVCFKETEGELKEKTAKLTIANRVVKALEEEKVLFESDKDKIERFGKFIEREILLMDSSIEDAEKGLEIVDSGGRITGREDPSEADFKALYFKLAGLTESFVQIVSS